MLSVKKVLKATPQSNDVSINQIQELYNKKIYKLARRNINLRKENQFSERTLKRIKMVIDSDSERAVGIIKLFLADYYRGKEC